MKMEINRDKSGIIFLRKKARLKEPTEEELRRKILGFPVKRQYKYLGVIFDEAL